MHFSIPDSQEVKTSDSTYLVYNVHINGNFHCALRYRQVLGLHEQLRKEFGSGKLPSFPPKKFLSLSATQLEERRSALEKYIQNASQNYEVAISDLFSGFLRLAQHETSGELVAKKPIDVFFPNGHKLTLDLWNNSPSSVLLKLVTRELKLREDFAEHFGLYIFRRDADGTWIVLRKLEEYESPHISLKWLSSDHRIVLRKCTWDLSVDDLIIEDKVGLHLIYVQTVSDIENGWIAVPKESLKQLTSLQSHGNKRDYVRAAQRLKYYGFMKFSNCTCDYPQANTNLTVYVGNRDLVFLTSRREEVVFKVTRMKCWRITLHHDNAGAVRAEISFEYLQSKDKLEWITIKSEQAVIMAVCLQEMVANMVSKAHPSNPSMIGIRSVRTIFYYVRRDGEQLPLNEDIILGKLNGSNNTSSSASTTNGSSGSESPSSSSLSNGCGGGTPTSSLSRHNSCDVPLSSGTAKRRPSNNSLRQQNSLITSNDNLFRENSAFAGIGDDDL
ncbi:unnamed protein product [Allacma fusca]|uniref:PX domain-containing protein n=1 Tax=Allacma fusca TaxID=39272 RepID=A0A8J2KN36_9HEXA|nr:unnamed protein product [Allacma fusca]